LDRHPSAVAKTSARHPKPKPEVHALYIPLLLSLEACAEAIGESRPFSWACSHREQIAAQDYAVSVGFRNAVLLREA
jgi:hypothetical protein